jgi:alpha-N-arabinofuranosidase
MRDAVVAALTLHIFQEHAGRVVMGNIAQMVNVLQAMILTDGPRMVLTPTYHVFDMLKVHQGAARLAVDLVTPRYVDEPAPVPLVSASASRAGGRIHLSLVNTDPDRPVRVVCAVTGARLGTVGGTVLTAPTMQAHNTFDDPGAVRPSPFTDFSAAGDVLTATLPPKSVAVLEITPRG